MPINLKKTDIEFRVDSPDTGYLILGFDADGQLVKKDENGVTTSILPVDSTGEFVTISAEHIILGTRSGGPNTYGQYSISQGTEVSAQGKSSSVRGYRSHSTGKYSSANGEYVVASGDYSYVWGSGIDDSNQMVSGGVNSFVHQYSIGISGHGTLSDYSAILGGYNNDIGTGSDNSAVIGGNNNAIQNGAINTVIIGGSNVTAVIGDAVYAPRLILSDGNLLGGVTTGMVRYNSVSGNIEGYVGGSWISMTTIGATGDFVTLDTTQTVTAQKIFSNILDFNNDANFYNDIIIKSSGFLQIDNGAGFICDTEAEFSDLISGVQLNLENNIEFSNTSNHAISVATRTSVGTGYHLNIDAGIGSNNNNGGNLYLKAGIGSGTGVNGDVYIEGRRVFIFDDAFIDGDKVATETWVTNTGGGMSQSTGDGRYYRKDSTIERRATALDIAKIGFDWIPSDSIELRLGQTASNGWCRLFNDMILQWFSYISDTDDDQTVTFPVAFTNGCVSVNMGAGAFNTPHTISNTGFIANRWNSFDGSPYIPVWAIGY